MFFLNGMLRHSLTFDHFPARKVKKKVDSSETSSFED